MKTRKVWQPAGPIIWWSSAKGVFAGALRASGIGAQIGALPGTGGDIAALLAYDHARRSTRNPEVCPSAKAARKGWWRLLCPGQTGVKTEAS